MIAESGLDTWPAWVVIKSGLASGLREIEEHWSLEDIWEAVDAIGLFGDVQAAVVEAVEQESKIKRGK